MVNKNDMSYYLPNVSKCGFNIPKTTIFKINDEWFSWLQSDHYTNDKIKEFNDYLLSMLNNSDMCDLDRYFIKTGNFSNKFDFDESCLLIDKKDIGKHFLNIFYASMLVGCDSSKEIVIREFIETNYKRKYIYNGMKLNTEFRVFYDFKHNELLGIYNYWDSNTMKTHLRADELKSYEAEENNITSDYNELKSKLEKYLLNKCRLDKSDLDETWSIDFLWDGEKFWMIDMALAKNSYYYNEIYKKDKNKDVDDHKITYTEEEYKRLMEIREKEKEMLQSLFNDIRKEK